MIFFLVKRVNTRKSNIFRMTRSLNIILMLWLRGRVIRIVVLVCINIDTRVLLLNKKSYPSILRGITKKTNWNL